MSRNSDILYMTDYIKDALYFAVVKNGKVIKNTAEVHYFSIDSDLVYENYYNDFGPLNLGCVYQYCRLLNEKLKMLLNKQIIVHYTSVDPCKKANAAFLLGCFGVLYLSLTPRDALKPLMMHGQSYRPFQDATKGDPVFTISLLDCLSAIKKARDLGFFNFQDFNYEEYERLDKLQGGDLNWLVPGKFLAFIGPVDYSVSLYHPPEMYIDYFIENNVKTVIRLNKKLYDENVFRNMGIAHYDLFFPDGSLPPRHILFRFLQLSEEANGAIAVHCKAGLGRTGSLIGCYLIKHYRMTSLEAIGWMRICRPGSVIGHQQGWLQQAEAWLTKQGNLYRKRKYQNPDHIQIHTLGVYSIAEKKLTRRLLVQKTASPPSPPPPVQRLKTEIGSPTRPRASKFRGATIQPTADNPCAPRLTPAYSNFSTQTQKEGSGWGSFNHTLPREVRDTASGGNRYRGGRSGAGDRPPKLSATNPNPIKLRKSEVSATSKQAILGFYPMPPVMPRSANSKDSNSGNNIRLASNQYGEEKRKQLNNALTVISQRPTRPTSIEIKESSNASVNRNRAIPSIYNANAPRPVVPARRRLGRSPSPAPKGNVVAVDRTRATNTNTATSSSRSPTPTSINRNVMESKDVFSGFVSLYGREHSLGAASLGARRGAPPGEHAQSHSVRSDERQMATQGDMLNSIKLQRRLKETWQLNSNKPSLLIPNIPVAASSKPPSPTTPHMKYNSGRLVQDTRIPVAPNLKPSSPTTPHMKHNSGRPVQDTCIPGAPISKPASPTSLLIRHNSGRPVQDTSLHGSASSKPPSATTPHMKHNSGRPVQDTRLHGSASSQPPSATTPHMKHNSGRPVQDTRSAEPRSPPASSSHRVPPPTPAYSRR